MFIDFNQYVLERLWKEPKRALEYALRMPRTYYCLTVGDFIVNEKKIRPTGFVPFNPGRKYKDESYICISSAIYKKREHLPNRELAVSKLLDQMGKLDESLPDDEASDKIFVQTWNEGLEKLAVGELFDNQGNTILVVNTPIDTPERKLHFVELRYRPVYKMIMIEGFRLSSPRKRGKKKRKKETLLKIIGDMVLTPSPQPV